jgi:hypothetical protein
VEAPAGARAPPPSRPVGRPPARLGAGPLSLDHCRFLEQHPFNPSTHRCELDCCAVASRVPRLALWSARSGGRAAPLLLLRRGART